MEQRSPCSADAAFALPRRPIGSRLAHGKFQKWLATAESDKLVFHPMANCSRWPKNMHFPKSFRHAMVGDIAWERDIAPKSRTWLFPAMRRKFAPATQMASCVAGVQSRVTLSSARKEAARRRRRLTIAVTFSSRLSRKMAAPGHLVHAC